MSEILPANNRSEDIENIVMHPTRMLALLRAINVGGRSLPMADLRAICATLGWTSVQTYIQSGNVIFESSDTPKEVASRLTEAIADATSLDVPVVVRTAAQWTRICEGNPFPHLEEDTWKHLLVGVGVDRIADDAIDKLAERAAPGELVEKVDDTLWIYFDEGVARSRLTPAAIDRAARSRVTMRNLKTVLKLREMLTA